jgi:hypothetical protein
VPSLRRAVGAAVGLASLAYFAMEVLRRWPDIERLHPTGMALAALGAAAALQAGAAMVDGWSWGFLLRALHVDAATRRALGIFAVAQFAKYLPGNVGQHLGRVALAQREGFQTGRVVVSLLIENGFAVGSGALVALASLTLADTSATPRGVAATAAILVVGWCGGALVLRAILLHPPARLRSWLALEEPIHLSFGLLAAYLGVHIMSYALLGLTLCLLIWGLSGQWPEDAFRVPAAAAVAWLAGYLVPGAPAGLGIREATITALLGARFGTGVVVSAVVLWRLAGLLADGATFLIGLWLRPHDASAHAG